MLRSLPVRIALGAVAVLAVLFYLRYGVGTKTGTVSDTAPSAPGGVTSTPVAEANKKELTVGFLPVTCHLTCPVTDFASKTSGTMHFVSQRFTDFPTVAESIKAGRLKASFMIAPLAMKLREQGIPVKICYLGHRDGSTVMVRKEDPAKDLSDLKGKTFAIPSKYSNQYLVINKLMRDKGVNPADIKFVELPPPDMPGALASKAIDAYFVGEPHAARAELDGTGRVLYHAKDIWPHFISCVLVVTEDLIKDHPDEVRDLVRGIAQSGEWAETHRAEAAKVATNYFKQKEDLIKYVLTTPPDRVSYRMLTPTDAEIQQIADMGLETGVLTKRVMAAEILDRSFIPKDIQPAAIDMRRIADAKPE